MKPPRLPWTRLTICLGALLCIAGIWRWAVNHLYVMPEAALGAFQAITINFMYTAGVIVIFAVTGKLVWDWKNATQSAAETAVDVIREKREVVVRQPKAAHFDGDDIE